MEGPILGISAEQILDFIEKVLGAIKKVMAWLGILILPEEETTGSAEETTVA